MDERGVDVVTMVGVRDDQEAGPILEVVDAHKRYGGVAAIAGVSMSLREGKTTAIIGPNGAGKSTLFNLITARTRADRGRIVFRGRDITSLSTAKIARLGIGRVFQDVRLFAGLSALENAAVYGQGPRSASLWRTMLFASLQFRDDRRVLASALEALRHVGIEHHAEDLAGSLSYADQKLVSLARLLARGSTLFLLDEPASGLDPDGREVVIRAVEALRDAGYSVALVEHNLDVVRRLADWVVFMAQGRVLAEGVPADIFASEELAEMYFGGGGAKGAHD